MHNLQLMVYLLNSFCLHIPVYMCIQNCLTALDTNLHVHMDLLCMGLPLKWWYSVNISELALFFYLVKSALWNEIMYFLPSAFKSDDSMMFIHISFSYNVRVTLYNFEVSKLGFSGLSFIKYAQNQNCKPIIYDL